MTACDLAKEWLRSEMSIENAAKFFEFCGKLISGSTGNGNLES
jgi:hypothetical protein